jgi:uncharacterized protein YfdQ (DUF2303 family)
MSQREFLNLIKPFSSLLLTFAAPNGKNINPNTAMNSKTKITVAYGDGIGPEIMKATLVAF